MIPAEHEGDCKLALKKWRRVVIDEFALKQIDEIRGSTRSSRTNDCLKVQNGFHQRIYSKHELDLPPIAL